MVMGRCTYCGESAGLLRQSHPECRAKAEGIARAEEDARRRATEELEATADWAMASTHLLVFDSEAGASSRVADANAAGIAAQVWRDAVQRRLVRSGGFASATQLDNAEALRRAWGVSDEVANADGSLSRLDKLRIALDASEGRLPEWTGRIPANLVGGERPVWGFEQAGLSELTKKQWAETSTYGDSAGGALRVASGIYVYAGGSSSTSSTTFHEHEDMEHVARGMLLLTTQNIYFVGANRSLRVPYREVVSILPAAEGFILASDRSSGRPRIVSQRDPWDAWLSFALATTLCRIAAGAPVQSDFLALQPQHGQPRIPGLDLDKLIREAAEVCIQHQQGSTSLLQRRLKVGYGRAARLIDQLQAIGVLGPPDGSRPRDVLGGLEDLDRVLDP